MVEIISGEKGKGKTRVLLDKVHEDLKKCGGSLIFICDRLLRRQDSKEKGDRS